MNENKVSYVKEPDCIRHQHEPAEILEPMLICRCCAYDYIEWKALQPKEPWDPAGMMLALSSRTHLFIGILNEALNSLDRDDTGERKHEVLLDALNRINEIQKLTPTLNDYQDWAYLYIFDHHPHVMTQEELESYRRAVKDDE